ncbi:MAG TPA: ATP-binding protein [Thermoanaerobaculia bacterium]
MARTKAKPCDLCNGTGWVTPPNSSHARPCRCQRDVKKQRRILTAQIPKRYLECTLDSFHTDFNPSLPTAKARAEEYVAAWLPSEGRGLLLVGPCGVGKTHLAVAILLGIIDLEKPGKLLFANFQDLIQEIQASFSSEAEKDKSEILAPVTEADLLVLDELGAQKPSVFIQDMLYHIINTRYNQERPTIFTTNFFDKRDDKGETLADRIGPGIRSRLYDMTETVELRGVDYRVRKKKTIG